MVTALHVLTGDGYEDSPAKRQLVYQRDAGDVVNKVGKTRRLGKAAGCLWHIRHMAHMTYTPCRTPDILS